MTPAKNGALQKWHTLRKNAQRLFAKKGWVSVWAGMLESAQQTKKIDLNYYVINHQWFRVPYIILCNFTEHKFADLAYKGTQKKRKEKI